MAQNKNNTMDTSKNFKVPSKTELSRQQQKDEVNEKKLSCFEKFVNGPMPAYSLVFIDFFGLGCIMPLLPFFSAPKEHCNLYERSFAMARVTRLGGAAA